MKKRPAPGLGATLLLAGLLSCAHPPPSEDERMARGVFAEGAGETEIMATLGGKLPICHPANPTTKVCTWKLSSGDSAWESIAALVPTRERVHLVCFFPTDEKTGGHDCTVFPAARTLSATPSGGPEKRSAFKDWPAQMHARLDAARTISELSWLIGSGPDTCVELDEEYRRCQWQLNDTTPGYLTLARIVDSNRQLRLTCAFPADGSPRSAADCLLRPL